LGEIFLGQPLAIAQKSDVGVETAFSEQEVIDTETSFSYIFQILQAKR
jgi:hypothetical protein